MSPHKKYGRIGVLLGGVSSEREISFKSGKAIVEALKEEGCDVVAIEINTDDKKQIMDLLKKEAIDLAFIALHGRFGEDGGIQAILDECDIPFTGSGVKASQIAINKIDTQRILKHHQIPVAEHIIAKKTDDAAVKQAEDFFKMGAVVVKPACEGSSIGVTIVKSTSELLPALTEGWRYGEELLVERFINGREMTVGIVDGKALAVIEVCPQATFFDFTAKYKSPLTQYKIPAEISEQESVYIRQMALKSFMALGCSDFGRVDVMATAEGKLYVLEVNTIPGFTSTSLLPKAAKLDGISFNQLCLTLIDLAYGKKKTKQSITASR